MANPQVTDSNYKTIQVFPIHKRTIQGVVTDMGIEDYRIIHADEDVKITFTFTEPDGTPNILTINLVTGEDVGFTSGFERLTSDGSIKVS